MNEPSSQRRRTHPPIAPAFTRATLTSVCVLTWIGLLVAGWWPFNFIPSNRVTWLRDGHGIHFEQYAQVLSLPPSSPKNFFGPFTLDLWLRSTQRGFDYTEIVSFGSAEERGLVFAQSGPDLVVEATFSTTGGSHRKRRIFIPQAFATASDRFVSIAANDDRTQIYLDSTLQRSLPPLRVEGLLNGLLIGHSPTLNDPWSGDFLGLGLFRRFLDADEVVRHRNLWRAGQSDSLASEDALLIYPVEEGHGLVLRNLAASGPDLVIPIRFYRQGNIVLEHSLSFDRSQLVDILVNVAGFSPFGFLLALWAWHVVQLSRPQSVIFAIAGGMLISLLIELLQIYLPTRDSSLIDVIGNSFGASCGAFAWCAISVSLTRDAARKNVLSMSTAGCAAERKGSLG